MKSPFHSHNQRYKSASGGVVKNENIANQELHKPIIRKFEKPIVESPFINNTWDADLADMQLIRKLKEGISFLLFFINIFSKYAWVIPL